MTTKHRASALLLYLALAGPWCAAHAQSDDIPQWYGTITFSKTLSRNATTSIPAGEPLGPGIEINTFNATWSGTARFIPGRKMVVAAHYTLKRVHDRKTDRVGPCPWKDGTMKSHDYALEQTDVRVPVSKVWDNSHLSFRIAEDGTYRGRTIVSGGQHLDGTLRHRSRREFFTECGKPNLDVKDQEIMGSDGMPALSLNQIAGKAARNATTLSGSFKGKDDDEEGTIAYSWNLTRAEPLLVARIEATPLPVQRGEIVKLSAAASTGPITRYEWQFTPRDDCQMTLQGMALRMTGSSVSFRALCDFTAELKVSNDKVSDSASAPVMVAARRGDAWKTKFKAQAGPPIVEAQAIFADFEYRLGVNQCTLHQTDEATGHWVHTDEKNNRTWRSGGYVLAQVQDAGPFKGTWYVESQSLRIDRKERVNSELLAAGRVFLLNQQKNNARDLQKLVDQVRAHEAAHSQLVDEALQQLGPDGDPAVRIERLVVGGGEDLMQTLADMQVREVNSLLSEASEDDRVKNRLRSDSRFAGAANVWLPLTKDSSGAARETRKVYSPLWGLGH